jgi:serine/threonine protein kinase
MAPDAQTTTPCPHCGKAYTSSTRICPDDGSVIEHASTLVSQVGAVLDGKYRLDSFLSQGGMGAVYRATHIMLGKTIAVKLIKPELVTSSEVVRRFQREARAATALNHPNIVAVYDLGQTSDGTLYIAMEFVDGPSLKEAIERGHGVAPARAVMLLQQVAAALSRAHRHGIVHRDLKPHNIMLARGDDGREVVKLVDFGIAKTFNEATQLTSTGFPIGTPHYMPPEQASGSAVDARSDLYSVGVILYEMLTGNVPFDDMSTPAILIKHLKEAPIPPSIKTPGVIPPVLDEIALRLLEKDPANRYQTAEELAAALDQAATTIDAPDATLPMPRKGAMPPTRIVQSTPVQTTAASAADQTLVALKRPPAPTSPAAQSTPVQSVPASTADSTVVAPKPTAAPSPAVAAALPVPSPVLPLPPPVVISPSPAATSAASRSSSSSAIVVLALVLGILVAGGAAYYYTGRGPSALTGFVTTAPPTATPSPSPQSAVPAQASAAPVPAAPAVSRPSTAEPPGTGGARPSETAPTPPTSSTPGSGTANGLVSSPPPAGNPPATGNPSSTKVASSAPPPPRGTAPPSQGRGAAQASRGTVAAASPSTPATQAPVAQAPPASSVTRREEPARQAAPASFPEKPAVYFHCLGVAEICAPLRTAMDEALEKAGLPSVRRVNGADVDVAARVDVVQQKVDRQFGTTFAVRTYSIELDGETTKTGEAVSMPGVENLSFDQQFGSERANERARVVAAGVVDRVKAFAAAKKAR